MTRFASFFLAALACASASACGGHPPPETAATPPVVPVSEAPIAHSTKAGSLVVSNQCSGTGKSFSLHVRIDADPIGGERPAASRVLWSVSCKEGVCSGTRLDLDAWLAGTPLDASGLGTMDGVELVEGSTSAFSLRWGPRMFRVDLSRSEVTFEESGASRQRGVAPCSSTGVPFPSSAR